MAVKTERERERDRQTDRQTDLKQFSYIRCDIFDRFCWSLSFSASCVYPDILCIIRSL